MLAIDQSPMHCLVAEWWQAERLPSRFQAPDMRKALFAAALAEIEAHIDLKQLYDPICDVRFKWAIQHLERIEGDRRSIDPGIHFAASTFFDSPPPVSTKELAAGTSLT